MSTTNNNQHGNEVLFIGLISSLYQSGMQQLGKLVNPITGKISKDLQAAKSTIDILEMLKEKTKGNLSKQEENMLLSYISNLQINYVEEVQNKDKAKDNTEEKKDDEKKENK